ncbi:hypothetical protein HPP92_000946 [Vanilla planifolia]|uniref:Uncharacterized protein n=1 Tax=Vanilla planifolia TaxID=51239 RepID=A0A835VGL1_VANPL|nr:hypothetical protein HPP92_000946 [Vanilla planifolia]
MMAAAWRKIRVKESYCGDRADAAVPRGYIPLLVGPGDGGRDDGVERFLVHVRLLKEPSMAALLHLAAEEFGYEQEGVLRIPCCVEHFRRTVDAMCRAG